MELQYNKLYQSLKKVHGEWHAGHVEYSFYWSYIKFYEDSTLIEAIINTDNLDKINANFHSDNSNISKGHYSFEDKELLISIDKSKYIGGITKQNEMVIQNSKTLSWELYKVCI